MEEFEQIKEMVKASGKCSGCTISCNPNCVVSKAKELLTESFGKEWFVLLELAKLKTYFHSKRKGLFNKDASIEEKFLQRLSRFNDLLLSDAPGPIISRALHATLISFYDLKKQNKIEFIKDFAKTTGG